MTTPPARLGYRFGRFLLQPAERRLLVDGQPAALGPRALDVLLALVQRAGQLVAKDELLDLVWPGLVVEENNLQTQVSWLRKVLGPQAIATVQGSGYRFTLPVQPVDEPPQRPAAVRSPELPRPLTRFVGREKELAAIRGLLGQTPLLTLTGAGGCGKTRLGLRVAADAGAMFPDGVWFVSLASLADPGLLPQALATTLGLKELPGTALAQTLVDAIAPRQLLLVLDNCEHLLAACATLVDMLLRHCPAVVVLATSRERLGIDGEQNYPVRALGLPDRAAAHTPQSLAACESVQLFMDRALRVQPDYQLTQASCAALASLCWQLDGMPLAIELAAARVRTLSVEDIARKIEQRFALLTGGSRSALPHHQTLRSLCDWSYDLLNPAEQRLLQRLSVFAGGWTLEAAEAVCADPQIATEDILNLLTSLADKSLVVVEPEPEAGHCRHRYLETLRQYAWDRLRAADGPADVQRRHLQCFLALAEEAESALLGGAQQAWLDRLEAENDNLRAALDWALGPAGAASSGLQLAAALCRFWLTRGHLAEGRSWLARLIAAAPDAPEPVRAKAQGAAGSLATEQGDYAAAKAHHETGLAIARALGDQQAEASALNNLGIVAEECGDYDSAQDLHAQALALRRSLGKPWGIAASLNNLGLLAYDRHDPVRAQALFAEALAVFRRLGDRSGVATSLRNLGLVALDQNEHASARALLCQSLVLYQELGFRRGLADLLEALAFVGKDPADAARAATVWGAAARLRDHIGAPRAPNEQPRHDDRVAAARRALADAAAFDRAWQAGWDMDLEQAVALALAPG